jgi:hypothetical protein
MRAGIVSSSTRKDFDIPRLLKKYTFRLNTRYHSSQVPELPSLYMSRTQLDHSTGFYQQISPDDRCRTDGKTFENFENFWNSVKAGTENFQKTFKIPKIWFIVLIFSAASSKGPISGRAKPLVHLAHQQTRCQLFFSKQWAFSVLIVQLGGDQV